MQELVFYAKRVDCSNIPEEIEIFFFKVKQKFLFCRQKVTLQCGENVEEHMFEVKMGGSYNLYLYEEVTLSF